MECKILKSTRSNRLILVDNKTNIAFYSFDKSNQMYKYFLENYKDEIEDYIPRK